MQAPWGRPHQRPAGPIPRLRSCCNRHGGSWSASQAIEHSENVRGPLVKLDGRPPLVEAKAQCHQSYRGTEGTLDVPHQRSELLGVDEDRQRRAAGSSCGNGLIGVFAIG